MKTLFFLVVLVSLSMNSRADTSQDCNQQQELIAKLQNQLSNLEQAKANLKTLLRNESEFKNQSKKCSDQNECDERQHKLADFAKQTVALNTQIARIEDRMYETIKELK